ITVTYSGTANGSAITIVKTAVNNSTAQTWEAYFDDVPPCTGASVSATCEGGTTPSSTGLTVVSLESLNVTVAFPVDGQEYTSLNGALGSGTRGEDIAVLVYATLGGELQTEATPVRSSKVHNGIHDWTIALSTLVPSPVAGGVYGLHVDIT